MAAHGDVRRVLLLKRPEEVWVARWLEHDVVGQGTSPEIAVRNLHVAIEMHASLAKDAGEEPFADLPPSPNSYLKEFEEARDWEPAAEVRRPTSVASWRFRRVENEATL